MEKLCHQDSGVHQHHHQTKITHNTECSAAELKIATAAAARYPNTTIRRVWYGSVMLRASHFNTGDKKVISSATGHLLSQLGLLMVNRLTDLFARIDPKSAGPINRRLSSYRPVTT